MSRTRSRRAHGDRQSVAAVCPQCGAEFVAGVETCSDCHVSLVAPRQPAERLTSPDGLVPIGTTFDAAFGRALAEAFDRAGIANHFEPLPYEPEGLGDMMVIRDLGAYVRPEDQDAARRVFVALDEAPARDAAEVLAAVEPRRQPGSVDAPSLRELMLADTGAPAASSRNSLVGYLHHGGALVCWGLVINLLLDPNGLGWSWPAFARDALGWLCIAAALALHMRAWRIGRDWRTEWAARAETERHELEQEDWEAIEAEERRAVEAAERGEPLAEDDRQPGEG